MDIRLIKSYERIEQLRWNIEEVKVALETGIQAEDHRTLGEIVCLCLRDLQHTSDALEEEVRALQKLNGVGSDEGQEE